MVRKVRGTASHKLDQGRKRNDGFSHCVLPSPGSSPIVFVFVLGSAFARLNLLLYEQQYKRKRIPTKPTHRLTPEVFVRAYMTYYPQKPILRLGYQGMLQLSTWRTRGLEDLLDLLPEELETALDQEKENAQGNERPMKTKLQSTGKRYRFYMSNLRKRKVWNLPTNVQVKLKFY